MPISGGFCSVLRKNPSMTGVKTCGKRKGGNSRASRNPIA